MSRFDTSRRRLFFLAGLMALVCVLTSAPGCGWTVSEGLVVATGWPLQERRRLELEFQNWLKSSSGIHRLASLEIDWLVLAPGDDLVRVVARRHPPDVLLGGRASTLASLAGSQSLDPILSADSALWSIVAPGAAAEQVTGRLDPIATQLTLPDFTLNDPRSDPISLARALGQLDHGHFAVGYSQLARIASNPRRIGRQASLALLETGRAKSDSTRKTHESAESSEGVAILRSARNRDLAQEFLRFLVETRQIGVDPAQPPNPADPAVESLVADLLGSTLVDAQDELWAAWAAVERAGNPAMALKWMTETPPWPPASVAKILDQPGEPSMTLIETLAREIAPEPAVRAWLVRSWLAPHRLIDDRFLTELTQAAEGRLCREPRFRAWLRAEWTAWARQRYRRVLRVAGS